MKKKKNEQNATFAKKLKYFEIMHIIEELYKMKT